MLAGVPLAPEGAQEVTGEPLFQRTAAATRRCAAYYLPPHHALLRFPSSFYRQLYTPSSRLYEHACKRIAPATASAVEFTRSPCFFRSFDLIDVAASLEVLQNDRIFGGNTG